MVARPGVDWLTLSVPDEVAGHLLGETDRAGDGHAGRGFRQSEERLCVGGRVWRRWGPFQPSKQWGTSYESWEWDGCQARAAARAMRGRDGRPSRVDVAFDFSCSPELTACQLVEGWRSEGQPSQSVGGQTMAVSGDEPWLTRYVGAQSSDRRIRVYRKDVQDPTFDLGAVMRVELVLKDRRAREWWAVWQRDEDSALAAAAAHVEAMTGWAPLPESGELPEREAVESADVVGELFAFVQQHGQSIATWESMGVPVVELCMERAAQAGRSGRCRMRQRAARIAAQGVDAVVGAVRVLLAGGRQAASTGG